MIERHVALDCFGSSVELRATCERPRAGAVDGLLETCAARLRAIHAALTRFEEGSELCRLNADPRELVPASPLLRRLARAIPYAGLLSGGLVDATCLPALERAGYERSLQVAAPSAPARSEGPGAGHWRLVSDDRVHGAVRRPPGVRIDSGGLAKGMAADGMAAALAGLPAFVVDCAGDVRLGGACRRTRPVEVRDPWRGAPVHQLRRSSGAVATSGVTARRWQHGGHHLIDPRTGAPADTDVAQATALAPTALEAEVRAKAAVLAGSAGAAAQLVHGGVVVTSGGGVHVLGNAA